MTTLVTLEMGGTGSSDASGARTALGVPSSTDLANAYSQANNAYAAANNVSSNEVVVASYAQANSARDQANNAYAEANTAGTVGLNAYAQANASRDQANTARTQANDAYGQANTGRTTANNAYASANLAYAAANNSNLKLGGLVSGTLNVTQDLIIGGNIYLEGNTTYINVATYSVEDSLIYMSSNNKLTDSVDIGFMGGKNTGGTYAHTGLARDATDGKWKLFDGLAEEGHVGNVVDFANTYLATLVANVEANTLSVVNGVSGNVNFDSGTLFIDSVGNKVGIGTTNPTRKLQVFTTGGDMASFVSANTGFVIQENSSGLDQVELVGYRDTDSSYNDILIRGSAVGLFINATTGNVGVGTTSASYPLDVLGSAGGYIARIKSSSNYGAIFVDAGSSGSVGGGYVGVGKNGTRYGLFGVSGAYLGDTTTDAALAAESGSNIRFFTNGSGTESMRINTSGYVGIGTDTPTYLLQVTNSANTSKVYVSGPSVTTAGAPGASIFVRDTTATNGVAGRAGIHFSSSPGTDYTIGKYYDGSSSRFQIIDNNATELFVVTGGGDVGIGTTNPVAKFDVWGDITLDSASATDRVLYFRNQSANTGGSIKSDQSLSFHAGSSSTPSHVMTLQRNTLNVGIGTTSPTDKLDIRGNVSQIDGSPEYHFGTTSASHYNWRIAAQEDVNAGFEIASGTLTAGTNATTDTYTTRFVIKGDTGNVGIGTTAPSYKLEIVSSDTDSGLKVSKTSYSTARFAVDSTGPYILEENQTYPFRIYVGGAEVQRWAANGNVGIGTTSPSYKLDVNGEVIVRGTQGFNATNETATLYIGDTASYIQAVYDGGLDFYQNSTFRMRIQGGTGNVGIGTSSPINKLQVIGTIGISDGASSNRGRFFWTTSGFTGIGLYNDDNSSLVFGTNSTARVEIDVSGHMLPYADNSYNLGGTSKRWANIYTADLNLSNRDSQNDVDGTWGEWTIQEGEEDLYLLNRRNGKKFKFVLKEIE